MGCHTLWTEDWFDSSHDVNFESIIITDDPVTLQQNSSFTCFKISFNLECHNNLVFIAWTDAHCLSTICGLHHLNVYVFHSFIIYQKIFGSPGKRKSGLKKWVRRARLAPKKNFWVKYFFSELILQNLTFSGSTLQLSLSSWQPFSLDFLPKMVLISGVLNAWII